MCVFLFDRSYLIQIAQQNPRNGRDDVARPSTMGLPDLVNSLIRSFTQNTAAANFARRVTTLSMDLGNRKRFQEQSPTVSITTRPAREPCPLSYPDGQMPKKIKIEMGENAKYNPEIWTAPSIRIERRGQTCILTALKYCCTQAKTPESEAASCLASLFTWRRAP